MKKIVKTRKVSNNKHKWVIFAILVIFLIGSIFWYNLQRHSVFTINGFKVTQQEFKFFMEEKESDVRNYYQAQYNITLEGNIWTEPIDGKTPENYLKDLAFEECIKTKSLFLLANENKLIDFVDFDGFLKQVEEENKNRALSVKKGDIVYGMINFTKEEYLGHLKTQLETNLMKKLSQKNEDPLNITEEEISEYFKTHKEEWTENSTTTKVWDISVPKGKKESRRLLNNLREQLSSEGNADKRTKILESFHEIFAKERTFTADSYKTDFYSCMEVRTMADKLQVNEVSTILELENDYHLVWVFDRQYDEEKAYIEYKSRIEETLLHEKFNQYLEEYQSSLNIVVNKCERKTLSH